MKKKTAENRSERAQAFTQAANRRKPSILLAEDDVEMRRLLAWSLERAGYDVIECPDGMTLMRKLGYLDAHGAIRPADLVVSDIRMPGFTGMQVLQSAHDFGDALPIILVSAFADEAAYEQAERLGATALLAKPFDVEELIEKIGVTLEREPVAGAESEIAPDDANALPFPVEITFRHDAGRMDHAPTKDYVLKMASKLARSGIPVRHCRVAIDSLHGDSPGKHAYLVKLVLTAPRKPIVVECNTGNSDTNENLYLTLRVAFGKAYRNLAQLHDRWTARNGKKSDHEWSDPWFPSESASRVDLDHTFKNGRKNR